MDGQGAGQLLQKYSQATTEEDKHAIKASLVDIFETVCFAARIEPRHSEYRTPLYKGTSPYIFASERGQPLYNGQNDLSQCVVHYFRVSILHHTERSSPTDSKSYHPQ